MKTFLTSRKTQSIFSKTIHCFQNLPLKKQTSLFFLLTMISFQSKSINVQISQVDDACNESIGSIGAFASGGTLPYTFVWSNGTINVSPDENDTLRNLSAGTYSLTVYDALGDSAVGGATLTNYSNLDRNGLLNSMNMITNVAPQPLGYMGFACPNQSDGIMFGLLNIVGGIPPFSVTSFGTNTGNPNVTAYIGTGTNGDYFAVDNLRTGDQFNITITDNGGCSGNFSDTEIGPDYFNTNIITTTPATNGQSNGSMTIDHHSGPFTLNIVINDSLGFVASYNGVSGFMNLSNTLHPGTYTILMEYNNTRNVCDTSLTVSIGNTITNAGYYWVGGDGDWSDISHWSNTSGGAPFYSTPPTANDDVFFDSNSPFSGSCIVRFPSLPISECKNITVMGSPVFTDMGGFTEFEISGNADFGNAIFQFTSSFSQSVLRFKSDATANLLFPANLTNAQIQFSSANGTGVFNLISNLKISSFFLYAGTLNTNGFTVETESFSTAYTAFPRILNLSNSAIILSDIPNAGFNSLTWYCDTNLVVNAANASFSSSAYVNDFKMRNTDIKSLSFTNNVSFNLANVKITSLRNNQVGSGNLNLRGSGFLSVDTLIASAIGIGNSIITGFDSVVINQFTNNSVAPLYIEVPLDNQANYCSVNNLISTNQVIIFSGENAIVNIDSLLASSIWLDQSDTLPGNININYLDCSLSQGTGNYNASFFDKGCTIGTFILPAGDEFNLDTAVTINIDTLIATGTAADPIYILGNISGPQSNIHLNKTFCGDYLTILGINSNSAPFYAGINSMDLGNNSNILFLPCGAAQGSDYYWVGGTGNWSDYANHWATASGGTTFHISPPGPNDDVYFDANSFPTLNDTVKVDVSIAYCKNFDWTNATNDPVFYPTATINNLYCSGSFILCPAMTFDVRYVSLKSALPNNIFQAFNKLPKSINLNFDNPSGSWHLTEDINVLDTMITSILRVSAGTLITNNFNISITEFNITGGTALLSNSTITCWLFNIGSNASYIDVDSCVIVLPASVGVVMEVKCHLKGVHFNKMLGWSNRAHIINADSCFFNEIIASEFHGLGNEVKSISCNYIHNSPFGFPGANYSANHFIKTTMGIYTSPTITDRSIYLDTLVIFPNAQSFYFTDTLFINKQFAVIHPSGQISITSPSPAYLYVDSGIVCLKNVALQNIVALGNAQFFAGQGCVDLGGNTGWTFAPCSIITDIWPGDANYDLVVNNFDVLNIGLAYGDTGTVRAGASNNFVAQPAVDWSGFFQTGVNKKHADCNGDGIVDNNDTVAIAFNYGQNHPARLSNPDLSFSSPFDLYLEINPDSANLSDTVDLNVFLGKSTSPVDSIYGIAFTISFDTAYVDTTYMTFDYTGAWMGTSGVDLLTFQKTRFLDGAVDMAMVRTDHQNIAGFGFLQRIGIVVVDNIGAKISTPFTLSNAHAITYSEYLLAINTLGDSLSIDTSSVGINEIENLENMISVYPNPAKDKLSIRSGYIKMNAVEIYNSIGEIIFSEKTNSNSYFINATNLSQGVYLIRCVTDKGIVNKRIVIAGKE